MTMHALLHRRSSALLGATLLIATPLIGACGFSNATDQVNQISVGTDNRSGEVDVLGAVVVASEANSGVFVASLANNSTTTADALSGFGGDTGDTAEPVGTVKPIEIPAGRAVNMITTDTGIPVTGQFGAGSFVQVSLTFKNGQHTTMSVPVVRPCYAYATVTAAPVSPTSTPSAAPTTPAPVANDATEQADGGNTDPYSCDPPTRVAE